MRKTRRITCVLSLMLLGGAASPPEGTSIADALARAYATNPALRAARAQLRAVDEGVPQALSGWRPTVVFNTSAGYADGSNRSASAGGAYYSRQNRDLYSAQVSITQPLYSGGGTRAGTSQAENRVYGQRARLLAAEQQLFADTVNAFVGVIQAERVLALNASNERVLVRQLEATSERFRIGEVTRTDVAQADAALAGARSTRLIGEGSLLTARATYERLVGEAPGRLVEPQPLKLGVKNRQEISNLAATNNPNVIAVLFDEAASRDAIDLAISALLPQVSLQASGSRNDNSASPGTRAIGAQVVLNAAIPLYQGGAEYSRVRQAKQTQQQTRLTLEDTRRGAIQSATQAWETLEATRASLETTRAQIASNELALEGVTREAGLGARTTLDVLNAEQLLLNSRVTLVQNLANLVTASYAMAAAIGRLTARDVLVNMPLYDETAYYSAVRNKLAGFGDHATAQPGR